MHIFATILIAATFVGVWFFSARKMASMGRLMSNLMALPVAFVAAFCLMAILFFTKIISLE